MLAKICRNCAWADSLGAKNASSGICAISTRFFDKLAVVKFDDFCSMPQGTFKINPICPKCGQIYDASKTGEYPCSTCGMPKTHDAVPESHP